MSNRLLLLLLSLSIGCNRWVAAPSDFMDETKSVLSQSRKALAEAMPIPKPTHNKLWRPNMMVLPYSEIFSDRVVLHNVRDCTYRGEDDYDVRHFDQEVWLNDLQTLDFIVVPFKNAPSLAHTMLSFGLANGQRVVFSVEARLQKGESYKLVEGASRGFELMWVVGTERDLIGLRTEVRKDDVYLYRTRAQPQQVRDVFLAAVARVNQIARQPEFYDTLRNNCTTNIVDMVNKLRPGTIPEDIRVLLPGHSDKLLYDHGLLAASGPFAAVKQASRINMAAHLHYGSAEFSRAIRGELSTQ